MISEHCLEWSIDRGIDELLTIDVCLYLFVKPGLSKVMEEATD